MLSRLALLLPVLGLLLAACGDDDDDDTATATTGGASSSPAGEDAVVRVSDNQFAPGDVTVSPNHEVIWQWGGANPHSVVGTWDGEEVMSPRLTGTGTFTFSFDKPGTFEYECGVHGSAMSGTVTVR